MLAFVKECVTKCATSIYELSGLRELAEQFIEEGLFGKIPENIRYYLDFDAIARDLAMDYSQTTIAGKNYIFKCA